MSGSPKLLPVLARLKERETIQHSNRPFGGILLHEVHKADACTLPGLLKSPISALPTAVARAY